MRRCLGIGLLYVLYFLVGNLGNIEANELKDSDSEVKTGGSFKNEDLDTYVSLLWVRDYNYDTPKRIYDVGGSIFYKKKWQVDLSFRDMHVVYNFMAEKRIRFFSGIQYNYDNGLVFPVGFNFNIGHWFGLDRDRIIWGEKLVVDVIDIKNGGRFGDNWSMAFALRIKLG